jgi:hypothetical protein
MFPTASAVTPSAALIGVAAGVASGMNAVTLPSFALIAQSWLTRDTISCSLLNRHGQVLCVLFGS